MCVQSPETIVKYNELPKFNGHRIESIYAEYENSRYADGGGYLADILFYKCYVHAFGPSNRGKHEMYVKVLPKEYDGLFGFVENKGHTVFVNNLWYRMRDSANGSFTDQTLSMSGWSVSATTSSFSLYRGCSFMEGENAKYVIDANTPLGKKALNILGKSFDVEEIEFAKCGFTMKEGSLDWATKYPYPHTPIRYIDGMIYPDEKLPSWRWLHGMPYMQPIGRDDKKVLRVWDENLQTHFYLEQCDTVEEGEEGLVSIGFSYKSHDIYGAEGVAYCHTTRYNERCNYVWQTYTVDKVNKQDVTCTSYRGMEVMKKNLKAGHTDFYRITRRVTSNEVVENN